MLSFFAIFNATGATISTVATLSTNADITPAKMANAIVAHLTSGILSIRTSAISAGIFESMKRDTMPIVPAIISITFQSIAPNTSPAGRIPKITNKAAEPSAINALILGKTRSKT